MMTAPGFIDLQINGYGGIDFNSPETGVEELLQAAELLYSTGTAGFLATLITNDYAVLEARVKTIVEAIDQQSEPCILGIHLEGPFMSAEYGYRGAHPEHFMRLPDIEWLRRLQGLADGHLSLVTMAPELTGAAAAAAELFDDGILVAAGHTNAGYADLRAAVDAGMRYFTHIGNGCRQQIDRHNNIIINALACPDLTLCFIPDGFHLPEGFLRALFACRPAEELIAVSDTMEFGGCAPGRYQLLGADIVLEANGKLHLSSDENVLAGSSRNLFQCMNHLAGLDFLSEEELWQVGFSNPLKALGLDPTMVAAQSDRLSYDVDANQFVLAP